MRGSDGQDPSRPDPAREVSFTESYPLLLVPPSLLLTLISCAGKEANAVLLMEPFFPADLTAYLMRVLDGNGPGRRSCPPREMPGTASNAAPAAPSGSHANADEVFRTAAVQLSRLSIDTQPCFSAFRYYQTREKLHLLSVAYTPETQAVCRQGGLFRYHPRGYEKAEICFWMHPCPC